MSLQVKGGGSQINVLDDVGNTLNFNGVSLIPSYTGIDCSSLKDTTYVPQTAELTTFVIKSVTVPAGLYQFIGSLRFEAYPQSTTQDWSHPYMAGLRIWGIESRGVIAPKRDNYQSVSTIVNASTNTEVVASINIHKGIKILDFRMGYAKLA